VAEPGAKSLARTITSMKIFDGPEISGPFFLIKEKEGIASVGTLLRFLGKANHHRFFPCAEREPLRIVQILIEVK
jgi:hypothetical protein